MISQENTNAKHRPRQMWMAQGGRRRFLFIGDWGTSKGVRHRPGGSRWRDTVSFLADRGDVAVLTRRLVGGQITWPSGKAYYPDGGGSNIASFRPHPDRGSRGFISIVGALYFCGGRLHSVDGGHFRRRRVCFRARFQLPGGPVTWDTDPRKFAPANFAIVVGNRGGS